MVGINTYFLDFFSCRKPSVMKALFKCGKCNHSYMSNENLKAHIKNKHAELRPIMSKIAQQMLPRPSWKDIMASKVDKISVVKTVAAGNATKHDDIIFDTEVKVAKSQFAKIASQLGQRSTISHLPKQSPDNISTQPVKTLQSESQTLLKMRSGVTIKLNKYPKLSSDISQNSDRIGLSSLSSVSLVKSSPVTMISPTVLISKEQESLKGLMTMTNSKSPNSNAVMELPKMITLKYSATNLPTQNKSEPIAADITALNEIAHPEYEQPEIIPQQPRQEIILSLKEQELAQQEMLFLATPVKCYFCELGRSRMSKSDQAEFFHLQLDMTGQLGKGNPSDKDVENLATYLRVNIGIARKVLEHIGVGNQTREGKNRLSFIRRICWDNMVSLRDLCNSFEQVWRAVNMQKDMSILSQEVLGQVYRWKFLFHEDPYYQTFLNQIYIHIHQGQDGGYSFMRNKIVDIEIE